MADALEEAAAAARSRMTMEQRESIWKALTGLKPPEHRGYKPRDETDAVLPARLTIRQRFKLRKQSDKDVVKGKEIDGPRFPIRSGGRDDPSWQNNSNPWQENAVRALEEGGV